MPHMEEAYRNAIADHGKTRATHVSLHKAHPATAANELNLARQPIAWDVSADGTIEATSVPHEFDVLGEDTEGAGNATVGAVGFWNALADGVIQGSDAVPAETFATQGIYRVNLLRIHHQDPV